jgi:aspartate carbamoyltransferase regulatory subunit
MEEKIKHLQVSAIENGTVIDHICADAVFKVIRILGLDNFDNMVLFATNLDSKKLGKKGIIKVSNKAFIPEELNKISLVSPHATIIEIENYKVKSKKVVETPDFINGIAKCFNPKCITNTEEVSTRFAVIDKESIRLKCHYCEKITREENLEFK